MNCKILEVKQKYLIVIISVTIYSNSLAQPVNDVCSGAITISSVDYILDFSSSTYSGVCDIDCMLSDQGNSDIIYNLCAYDLWFKFVLNDSMRVSLFNLPGVGFYYGELYSGSCTMLTLLDCGASIFQELPSGQYFYKSSRSLNSSIEIRVQICPMKVIHPIEDVYACDSYTLPPISGRNLSGNQAYYTLSSGGGTQYLPGEVITTSLSLYAYDSEGCAVNQEEFSIDIATGGSNKQPIGPGGSWTNSAIWGFSRPDACDQVSILNDQSVFIGSSILNPIVASCKTLDIEIGADFEVILGGQLQVGTK